MTDITYSTATGAVQPTTRTVQPATRKSLLVRFYDALVEARTAQARREIARHLHVLPLEQRARLRRELALDGEPRL